MKSKYLFFLSTAMLLCCGCENAGFLNQAPWSQTSPENFYQKEGDIKLALISCYETINTHKIPGKGNAQRGSYAQGLIYIMNAPSDDMGAATASGTDGYEMEWASFVESTECVRDFWKVFYTGINRCNIVLAYLDKVDMSDETRIQYCAEARFLRAFFYYHLAWNFGGVPLVLDYASSGDEPRSSLKDVYQLILEDLDYAWEHLSGNGLVAGCSITKWGAGAYIGRICNYLAACKRSGIGTAYVAQQPLNDLSWVDADAMSTKARTILAEVVEGAPYRLNDDFMANFRECSKVEQNIECLFLSQIALAGSEGWWPNSYFLPTSASAGSDFPVVYGGRHVPFPRAFYMYNCKDPRRDRFFTGRITEGFEKEKASDGYTYGRPNYQDPNGVIQYDSETGEPVTDPQTGESVRIPNPLYETPSQTYLATSGVQCCPGKFQLTVLDALQHTYQQHALSYPLMRLADVYLMYAEALYFCGNEPEAREWMNKVLWRAAAAEGRNTAAEQEALYQELLAAYHRDNFVDELLESRERELVFEFSRKWDLIRFNRIDEAISSLNNQIVQELEGRFDPRYIKLQSTGVVKYAIDNLKENWAPHKIWLPISEEQRGVNKNLEQNPGW
ncbi:MAG: RagB/SusD family nutrient uptake outer membrane protein [Bacteroidales bacterium]|nr:RagB/SusD family nutrient uptake outer membrane protein [Bacteroidales bacterium]